MSQVIVRKKAAKYLQKYPKPEKERIKGLLKQLENDPLQFKGIKPMVGEWNGYYRIRYGNLRIILWYDENEDIVYIDHIGPRGDIYK